MKKLFVLIFLIIIIALLCSCVSDIVKAGGVVVRAKALEPADKNDYIEEYTNEEIVYTTKSGTKYHKEGCSYLSNSKIPISLEQAIKNGLEPCSKCYPEK